MKKLLSIILSITMLLSMATVAFADETGEATANGTIAVGINAEYAPFEYYEDGELTGFDIDLMNYIGERIGYDIDYVEMSFDKLMPAVVNGEVDCAISAITVTEERENIVDFTRPYLAANVTYKGGDSATEALEEYAIVFPNNAAEKANLLEASGQEKMYPSDYTYALVNKAIKELIDDAAVEKLIEKYSLNKSSDADTEISYEYIVITSTVTETKNDLENIKSKDVATTVPAPSEWAEESVEIANELGITYKSHQYLYAKEITREEFCELIYNLVVLVKPDLESFIPDSFTDTTNEKVLRLNSLGIVNGKTATEFAPNDTLTREEAATIIVRMVNTVMPMAATEMWFEYDDIDEVSEWASDSIQTISNLGFMKGVGNNNFAPKAPYTTEQAIATLVRVYESAEAAGIIDHNSSIGIIGGADGPTSILVGENTTIIGGADEPTQITVTDTIEVDDFYIDEAIKLITESGKRAADKNFISLYTTHDDMTNKLLSLGAVDFNKPTDIFYLSADREQIVSNLTAMIEADGGDIEDFGDVGFEYLWRKLNFSTLASLINGSYGSENLAALNILTNSRGYVMPNDFKNNFALFVQYEGDYSAIVSFHEYGDGVISANMSFVKNGDKDNVFRRIYEITSALGEGSIQIAKVKQ